ncbi:protein of unknown function [Ruminococcaceae bacterium BL-6]|nr:protein of unknown function [Ruminococcaceae bacterium BL-6]
MSDLKKEDSVDVEEMLLDAADNAVTQSEEDRKEQEIKLGERWHESHTDRRAISSILRKYKDGIIKLPTAQRLYVWNEKQRKSLLRTAKKGYGCGCLSLATHEGDSDEVSYLVDGQQRLISMMLLSNDKSLTEEERKIVLDYQMPTVTVYQLNWDEISEWFLFINSGVPVASMVKERSKLPVKLNNTILSVSRNQFFRAISEKSNTTFRKAHQHENIAENILLANAGCKVGSIKAKDICKRLLENESKVYDNVENADSVVERLSNIFKDIPDDIVMRSMNATFVSVLVYVMHDYPEIEDNTYVDLIKYIFASKRAIKVYSEACGRYSATEEPCKKRYDIIVNLLNNLPKTETVSDDESYHAFCRDNIGKAITTGNGNNSCDFAEFDEEERRELFLAKDDQKKWNDLVTTKYHELEQQQDIA